MSNASQGPGWWVASDGKWYAPELAPASQQSVAAAKKAGERGPVDEAAGPTSITSADESQGPGWWLASDGKWYAPELAQSSPDPVTATSGSESALHRLTSPDSLKKGVHATLGALEASGLTKVDRKSGEIKVKKLGLAKAAIRPGKTIRKAINGATADLVVNDKPPNPGMAPKDAS